MDNIEQLYKQHRDAMDRQSATPATWEALEQQLHPPASKKKTLWWAIAASLVIAIGLAGYFFTRTPSTNHELSEVILTSPQGEKVPLSSLKGKIVLVEFWASWSKMCTEENCYYFRPLYDEYKDKGFEIYGISVDTNKTQWVEGIERDQLSWVQVSDLLGFDSPIVKQSEITKLPTTYLLDRNGAIIAKDVNADELEEQLKKLLAHTP